MDSSSARRVAAIAAAVALVLVLAVFGRALGHGFVYDDHRLVERNPVLRDLDPARHLVEPFWSRWEPVDAFYRPLTTWSLALDRAVWGGHPAGFHATNLLLHALNAWLLFLIARRLAGGAGAALAAACFAVHPIQTESVAWVSGRTDLLAATLMLIGLWLWVRGAEADRGVAWPALGSAVAWGAALLAKEAAVTFPVLALGWEWARSGRREDLPVAVRRLGVAAPIWGLLLAGYLLLRLAVAGQLVGGAVDESEAVWANPLRDAPLATRWLGAIQIAARYLGLLVWPARLSADYRGGAVPVVDDASDPRVLVALVGLALAAALVTPLVRRQPLARFGIVVAVGAYALVANVVFVTPAPMAERLLYVPMIGVAALFGAGCVELGRLVGPGSRARRAGLALGCLVLLALAGRAYVRTADWRDDMTLFRATVEATPRSAAGWNNLGHALLQAGDHAAALDAFHRAIALRPDDPLARLNQARALDALDDPVAAEAVLRRELSRRPDSGAARLQLVQLLAARAAAAPDAGLDREIVTLARRGAEQALQQAGPGTAALFRLQVGAASERLGRQPDALAAFERAVLDVEAELASGEAAPEVLGALAVGVYLDAARFHARGGRFETAVSLYDRAVVAAGRAAGGADAIRPVLDHESAVALTALAEAALVAGRPAEARPLYDRALSREPGSARARLGRGRARRDLGDLDGAESDFRAVLDAAPEPRLAAVVWTDLARVAVTRGDLPAADRCIDRALILAPGHAEALRLRHGLRN